MLVLSSWNRFNVPNIFEHLLSLSITESEVQNHSHVKYLLQPFDIPNTVMFTIMFCQTLLARCFRDEC